MNKAADVRFVLQSTIYYYVHHIMAPIFHVWKSALDAVLLVRLIGTTSSAYFMTGEFCAICFKNTLSLCFHCQNDILLRRPSFNPNSGAVPSTGSSSIRWLW